MLAYYYPLTITPKLKITGQIKRKLFGVGESSVLMEKRGFLYDDIYVKNNLEKIGLKFLYGYHNSLYDSGEDYLIEKLNSVEKDFKGFSYEGAAMGLAMLDTISFFNKARFNNFMEGAGNTHIYMMHVGAGWAYAKLPVNVEKKMEQFDPLLKWLIMDGYGFCNAYFNTKKYVMDAKVPPLSEYGKHVFYQGLGRCLWFVEGSNPERIAARINSFPEKYAGDLWSGIGLASGYAGGVDREVIEQIKNYSGNYILNLAQGAAFAAKARIRAGNLVPHTNMANMIYSGIDANKAAHITDISLKGLSQDSGHSIPAYEAWRRNITHHLYEIMNLSLIAKN